MGSQKTKMGRLKKSLVIIGNIFAVIFMTSISIFCMEPEIITKKIPMTPVEAFADIGKYLAICLTFFAIARLMLGKTIRPACEKLFIDLDGRIKLTADRVQTFMFEMVTKFTTIEQSHKSLEKNVNELGRKIDDLITFHYKNK